MLSKIFPGQAEGSNNPLSKSISFAPDTGKPSRNRKMAKSFNFDPLELRNIAMQLNNSDERA